MQDFAQDTMAATKDELDNFLSKTDFDFSSVAGWNEFFQERKMGQAGPLSDGVHLRDIKQYAVGTANVISSGSPIDIRINVRQPGSGLALSPATLYVNFPDATGARQVQSFFVGGGTSSSGDFHFEAAGGGTSSSPWWDVIYYIIVKPGSLPGSGPAKMGAKELARRQLKEALRASGWLAKTGFRATRLGGPSYSVSVFSGGLPVQRDEFMPQEIITSEGLETLRDELERMSGYLD